MSTGKRLAKRSIIGTRVCASTSDGKYYSGVITAVKTPPTSTSTENSNCINITPDTRYEVRFDSKHAIEYFNTNNFYDSQLIGPGFRSISSGIRLLPGQTVYITYNGREVSGEVISHHENLDEVIISIAPSGFEPIELIKRLDEVRLLESRRSARLMDQDTDFARLADMAFDRKRQAAAAAAAQAAANAVFNAHAFELFETHHNNTSRKRRFSCNQDDHNKNSKMDECNAALVLMSLAASPNSPNLNGGVNCVRQSSSTSSETSWKSSPSSSPSLSDEGTQSLSGNNNSVQSDEGIGLIEDELPPRNKIDACVTYQCTWPGCAHIAESIKSIEAHVRFCHLMRNRDNCEIEDNEEEFYYKEIELKTLSPPTFSHLDMARPRHEDPEFQRHVIGTYRQSLLRKAPGPQRYLKMNSRRANHPYSPMISSPNKAFYSPTSSQKFIYPPTGRKPRGENKKCRKVYGMDQRDLWCTQCKWKKACSRFGD